MKDSTKLWLIPLGFVIAVAIRGLLVMLLWNELLTLLFDFPFISFLQAVGLDILAGIIFNRYKYDYTGKTPSN
jgi:hypothetical protein